MNSLRARCWNAITSGHSDETLLILPDAFGGWMDVAPYVERVSSWLRVVVATPVTPGDVQIASVSLMELLHSLKVEHALVMGIGSGAVFAQAWRHVYWDHVRALILVGGEPLRGERTRDMERHAQSVQHLPLDLARVWAARRSPYRHGPPGHAAVIAAEAAFRERIARPDLRWQLAAHFNLMASAHEMSPRLVWPGPVVVARRAARAHSTYPHDWLQDYPCAQIARCDVHPGLMAAVQPGLLARHTWSLVRRLLPFDPSQRAWVT